TRFLARPIVARHGRKLALAAVIGMLGWQGVDYAGDRALEAEAARQQAAIERSAALAGARDALLSGELGAAPMSLPQAQLSGAMLAGRNVNGWDLRASRFTGADLTELRAVGTWLQGADFERASLD